MDHDYLDDAYVAWMDEQTDAQRDAYAEAVYAQYYEGFMTWREETLADDPDADVTEEDYNDYLDYQTTRSAAREY